MSFSETNIWREVPAVVESLIDRNDCNAREFIKKIVIGEDSELLNVFGQYTLEFIAVHVLCLLFSPLDERARVRASTLIEHLESTIRRQAFFLRNGENEGVGQRKKNPTFPLGAALLQFMVSRGAIVLETDLEDHPPRAKKNKKGNKDFYYVHRKTYVQCKFDPTKLPIRMNLPMVCKPLEWRVVDHGPVIDLSALEGGYLSGRSSGTSYSLLTGDIHHFPIQIKDSDSLCRVMNTLQNQAFEINSDVLKYIEDREQEFIDNGYLLPGYLADINIANLYKEIRESHLVDTDTFQKIGGISELTTQLTKQVQRARYERSMLKLANAYKGYKIYLPAFLDFRGRIYRCGLLHFHERDLSRSLINFASFGNHEKVADDREVMEAFLYHYKSYPSMEDGLTHFGVLMEEADKLNLDLNYDIQFGRDARHPFQYLASKIAMSNQKIEGFPVTKDASASAFQIMSYFLLDEDMAKSTNLLPSQNKKIQDMDRKLVKSIFMPIIYGKTLMSTSSDIHKALSQHINLLDSHLLASLCFKFWKEKYKSMDSLTSLIRNIGWFAAAKGLPVYYAVPYFRTSQDSMKSDVVKITVYDCNHKKRQISLRVPTDNSDRRKTEVSTFVNFIHQKDAYIAMLVVEKMLRAGGPILHRELPSLYGEALLELGPPLVIINDMIHANLIRGAEGSSPADLRHFGFSERVIPIGELKNYFENNIPDGISKKMEATWRKRMEAILVSYESYASSISGVSKDYDGHYVQWKEFGYKILEFPEGHQKYALHP
ncbi:unnamed protein product [Withania somnifera]